MGCSLVFIPNEKEKNFAFIFLQIDQIFKRYFTPLLSFIILETKGALRFLRMGRRGGTVRFTAQKNRKALSAILFLLYALRSPLFFKVDNQNLL
jgi:hypothetical protein